MAATTDVLDRDELERTPALVQLEPRPARLALDVDAQPHGPPD